MFDRSFNGSSFDAHDDPVLCCRAVQQSNDCQTVATHESSGGKSTDRVQLQLYSRVWTKTQHENSCNPDSCTGAFSG